MRATLTTAMACLAVFLGCSKAPPEIEPPPPAPRILTFSAAPALVKRGEQVTLRWETENATSVELREAANGVISGATEPNGSLPIVAIQDGLFVLVASNDRGVRDTAAVWVEVDDPDPEIVFTATPFQVRAGEPATLAWHAPGAKTVSLAEKGGNALDLGGQLETGAVNVNPTVKTTWVLTVDGQSREATIDLIPVIDLFQVTPDTATPGQPLTLSWKTRGATGVTVGLAGTGDLHSETAQGKVAEGSCDYAVSPDLGASDILTFQLRAENETSNAVQTIQVYRGGAPRVTRWIVPRYAVTGTSFSVAWTTSHADAVEILRDGLTVHRSPSAESAVEGSLTFPAPMADQKFQLRAIDTHGGESLSEELTVSPVGLPDPASSTFTTSDAAIATGGTPVTLTLNVPNARNVKIVDVGMKAVGTVVLTAASNAPAYTITPGQITFLATNALSKRARFYNVTGGTLSPGGTLAVTVTADGYGADYNAAPNTITVSFMSPQLTGVTCGNPVVTNGTWLSTWGEDPTTLGTVVGVDAESGSIQHYPNRNTEYHLTGDNGVGTSLAAMAANVAVTTPARLKFSTGNVPTGAIVQINGATLPASGALEPLNFAAQNLATHSFVDISSTGTEIVFPTYTSGPQNDAAGVLVALPQPFQANWRGYQVGGSFITVNFQGWMAFSNFLATPPIGGTQGLPVMRGAIAILDAKGNYKVTRSPNAHVRWQMDGTGSQQRLIVQWTDVPTSTTPQENFTFQAQLYATGEVVLAYSKMPTSNASTQIPQIGLYAGDDATTFVGPSTSQFRNLNLPMAGDRFGLFTQLPASYDYFAAAENLRVSMDMGNGRRLVIQDAETLIPPSLVTITEAMTNPVSAGQEWIEITNTSNPPADFDLNGWDLEFANGAKYSFATPVKVPASGILVVGQAATAPAASAVNYFSYGTGFSLPKNGAPVVLSRSRGTYSSLGIAPAKAAATSGTIASGYAIQLAPKPATGWSMPTGVTLTTCAVPSTTTPSYAAGLYGTPGAANTTCPSWTGYTSITGNFEPLAGQSGTTQLTPGNSDNDIVPVPLTTPARYGAQTFSTVYVGTNGFVSFEPLTCSTDLTGTCYGRNPTNLNPAPGTPMPPVGVVAPFWVDLNLTGGGIYTARKTGYTIISWENVGRTIANETYALNFQVKLFDSGNIEFHYGTMSGTGTTTAGQRAKGYETSIWLQPPLGKATAIVSVNSYTPGVAPNSGYRFSAQ